MTKQLGLEELKAARLRQDWKLLWECSIPFVKYTIKRMILENKLQSHYATEDLLHEGYLAVGDAVRRWDPEKGAFSTWIMVHAYRGIRDHIRREASGMVGGRDSGSATMILPYWNDLSVDPNANAAERAERAAVLKTVRKALRTLHPDDRKVVELRFGIGGAEGTSSEIAQQLGLSERTIKHRATRALRKMARILPTARYTTEADVEEAA